jgi:hypothetical protein
MVQVVGAELVVLTRRDPAASRHKARATTADLLSYINPWMLPKGRDVRKVRGREVCSLDTGPMRLLKTPGRRAEVEYHQT